MSDKIDGVLTAIKDHWVVGGFVLILLCGIFKYRNLRLQYKKGDREFLLEAGNLAEKPHPAKQRRRELPHVIAPQRMLGDATALPNPKSPAD